MYKVKAPEWKKYKQINNNNNNLFCSLFYDIYFVFIIVIFVL